ncbi:MAG: hypothetical protein L6Q33_12500 [Bacteriovoracaceae bacterium]|jgi:flagellar motility protein MotE (MotC chaperone)|nr:hypothetical protein [Bacteriovoracaceae bacterium]
MRTKNAFIYTLVTLMLGSLSYAVISADSKDVKAPKAKTYTEEEFKKALQEEVDKTIKKVSGNHMVDFSKELLQKEEAIKVKELEVKKQEDQLKMNMSDFEKRVKEFQVEQKRFIGCVDGQDEKADKRVTQMVEVISGMRPQNAADLLSVQESDLAVKILGQLDPAKVSKIFNLMDKEISAKLQKQFMTMKK